MKARQRLKEVKFHLDNMTENNNVDIEHFEIFLNSFLSSARSVTWILKKECTNNDQLLELYNSTNFKEADKELLSLMTELRNKSQKSEPIKVTGLTLEYKFDFDDIENEGVLTPHRKFYSLDEYGYSDIEAKCRMYYEILDKLVSKFEMLEEMNL